jgi:hypothetical protein
MIIKLTNIQTEKNCPHGSKRIDNLREQPERSAMCRRVLVELPAA